MGTLKKLLADKRGVATIEYSLLAGFIALGVVTSVGEVGDSVADSLENVHVEWTDAATGNPGNGNGKAKGKGKPKGKP